jgi:pantoate--beta-alanine ligase
MQTVHTIERLRRMIADWRRAGLRTAFVPTMGNLHEGHLRLVDVARQHADRVVASVFVNPTQFGPNEDYARYPRTLEADRAGLEGRGCDLLFAPPVEEMYPDGGGSLTWVEVERLTDRLCGASRPGHFRGVTTVVSKLFNIVQPDVAVFGEKDFQQLVVIRQMVRDLFMPIEVVGVPTVREEDGLAMSSRNGYLSAEERAIAPGLQRCLQQAAASLRSGRPVIEVEQAGMAALRSAGFDPEYFSVVRQADLEPPTAGDRELVILAAARLGKTRLIDNLPLALPGKL